MDIAKIKTVLRTAWSSACQDKNKRPSCMVKDGNFIFTVTGNQDNWELLCKLSGVPSHAKQSIDGDTSVWSWPSIADAIFGDAGVMDMEMEKYETRAPQIHMARMVQRSIETSDVSLIEAGTGVGKSFAYAAVAMFMNKKVVISTSNKSLQTQLYRKDIPFLQSISNDPKKVVLVLGKKNYACRTKCENFGGITITDPELKKWYEQTSTGNLEDITFSSNAIDDIRIDDYCTGRGCSRYDDCFYYEARAERDDADVLICNHALFVRNFLYPGASILPEADLYVIDEAHQLESYARGALTEEITFNAIKRAMTLAEKYNFPVDDTYRSDFALSVQAYIGESSDKEIGVNKDDDFLSGRALASELFRAANDIWYPEDFPACAEETKLQVDAGKVRLAAERVRMFSSESKDGIVRSIKNGDKLTLVVEPIQVDEFIGSIVGYTKPQFQDPSDCIVCGDEFLDEYVFVSGQNTACCIGCIDDFDPLRWDTTETLLNDWLAMDHPEPELEKEDAAPMVFCSATLATPTMAKFRRDCGIGESLEMIAESPFDYASNALLYVPDGNTPNPSKESQAHQRYLIEEIPRLISASGGGALLLFTSYANMRACHEALAFDLGIDYLVLKQGDLPKQELTKRFSEDGNAVLFATKSYWEGVSLDGDACRLVIIDKLPFHAPIPLLEAQAAVLRKHAAAQGISGQALEFYPFNNIAIPHMITELKQGFGRLIRTTTDRGVVAILDPRLRTTRYGRSAVLPSLPLAKLTDKFYMVESFFNDYTPKKPATSMQIFALMADKDINPALAEEIPF